MVGEVFVVDLSETKTALADHLAETLGTDVIESEGYLHLAEDEDTTFVVFRDDGVSLENTTMSMMADFSSSKKRIAPGKLNSEMLVKAAKFKDYADQEKAPIVIDATAGLGEDSILLAAVGFHVTMIERDPVIAVLLQDALERGMEDPDLAPILERMELFEGDSELLLKNLDFTPDIVYLDPMFPGRTKSGLVKKKFQLIHQLEEPCVAEGVLFDAAVAANPTKIIVKRPIGANPLDMRTPGYSISGKTIRYDCYRF